jgi:hypothetical protein
VLAFFFSIHANIATMAAFINDFILHSLEDCASFFVDMDAIGVDALFQVWAELHEAPGQFFGRDIPGSQRANTS